MQADEAEAAAALARPQAVGDVSASGGPRTFRGLLRSPVVLLIILLPLAYWLFNEVYA